jgi:hypothetical protein
LNNPRSKFAQMTKDYLRDAAELAQPRWQAGFRHRFSDQRAAKAAWSIQRHFSVAARDGSIESPRHSYASLSSRM